MRPGNPVPARASGGEVPVSSESFQSDEALRLGLARRLIDVALCTRHAWTRAHPDQRPARGACAPARRRRVARATKCTHEHMRSTNDKIYAKDNEMLLPNCKENSKPFIFWVYMRITHRAAVTERPFGDRRRSWTIVRWGGDSSVVSVNTRLRSRMHGKCTAGARHTSQHAATLARLHLKRVARGPGTRP